MAGAVCGVDCETMSSGDAKGRRRLESCTFE